jgi:hypothetical protein
MHMKVSQGLQLLTLSIVAATSEAATVAYQHPDLTIVAKQEPLAEVLKSIGREMRIFITVPTGFNPTVNCNIQQQPVPQALKTMLKDVSYSLEWETGGERLAGITILTSGPESAVAAGSRNNEPAQSAAAVPPIVSDGGADSGVEGVHSSASGVDHETTQADHDAAMAEHEARMEAERAEMEAQIVEEREAQEQKLKEEVVRHDAEHQADLEAFLQSKGVTMPLP